MSFLCSARCGVFACRPPVLCMILPMTMPSNAASVAYHRSPASTIGLIISALAMLGWLAILVLIFSVHKEPPTGDPMGDVFIAPANGLAYLYQALVGIVGLSVNGTLSLVGTLVSAAAYGQGKEPRRRGHCARRRRSLGRHRPGRLAARGVGRALAA